MIALADFAGRWALTRRIDDALTDEISTMTGQAVFTPVPGGLDYGETGRLVLAGQAAMTATRRYLWRADGRAIAVMFADERAFHRFDPGAGTPSALHDCPPDRYEVEYDFDCWPRWRARWRARGPRKDYAAVSCYAPWAGAENPE